MEHPEHGQIRHKTFFAVLFVLSCTFSPAQENNLYKDIWKESLRESLREPLPLTPASEPAVREMPGDTAAGYIVLDVNKKPLPRLGYNYLQNAFFLSYKDSLPLERAMSVLAITPHYTNEERFDPNSTETTEDVIANGILYPVFSILMLRPLNLADFLMRTEIVSAEPFVPRETKKEKALREIKTVYRMNE
ncbi:MAG: hypothetical protein LBI65_02895 [Candidatus Symbiothrix sp.]|jgi:hypothetical protein|nr:hypothetical protein [Candidatus Symbiothrix sp.]